MREVKTLVFNDTSQGRSEMDRQLNLYIREGWILKSKETSSQGWDCASTCCLGAIFLPLGLLGRKHNVITIILEREVSENEIKDEEDLSTTEMTSSAENMQLNYSNMKPKFKIALIILGILMIGGLITYLKFILPEIIILLWLSIILNIIVFINPNILDKYIKLTTNKKIVSLIALFLWLIIAYGSR